MSAWSHPGAAPTATPIVPNWPRRLRKLLIWLSASNKEALELCGETAQDHASVVGGTVAGTTGLAFVSGVFYSGHVLRLPLVLVTPAGAMWALLIMNMDRYVLSVMRRQDTWQRTLIHAGPRLLLSAMCALVIVHALMFGIFAHDVSVQVARDNNVNLKADSEVLQKAYPQVKSLQDDIATVQHQLSSTGQGDILLSDPYYQSVARRYGHLRALEESATDSAQRSSYARQAKIALNLMLQQRPQLLNQASETHRSLEQRLASDQSTLAPLLKAEQQRRHHIEANDAGSGGLGAQARALSELVSSNSYIRDSYILIAALLFAVDFLPAAQRALALTGRLDPYDATLEELEATTIAVNRVHLEQRRTDAIEEAQHRLEGERKRRAAEDERRAKIHKRYVEEQATMDETYIAHLFREIRKHISRWAYKDAQREIDAIDAAYRRQQPER
jgi:hypothetical protein